MVDKVLPSDIEDPGKVFATKAIGAGDKEGLATPTPTQSFSSFMKQGTPSPMEASGKAPMISPFDLMQGQHPMAATPSFETLSSQTNNISSTLGDINSQLNTPNLKLKASTKYLVKNKLADATEHLKAFNAQIGAEPIKEADPGTFKGPLGRFLGYVQNGSAMMEQAKMQLQNLKDKGENMNAGDFLLIQSKLAKGQQLLEFTSVLLSNAVSDIKQLMQVQL
jgi:hypothetical protein